MPKQRILIVDEDSSISAELKQLFLNQQLKVISASSLEEAQQQPLDQFDLIVSELQFKNGQGTELIINNGPPVIIITHHSSLRAAIDTMKKGAVDYFAKPFPPAELLNTVAETLSRRSLTETVDPKPTSSLPHFIGQCDQIKTLTKQIDKVAPTDATVLILGESGTGKELVAKALHHSSKRHQHPLISVNCAAIPETLIESELFGHEKGAFTGATSHRTGLIEAANGGTLFLDEIGELPLDAQARLLRVLQEGEIRRVGSVHSQRVDIRLIAATHRDLKNLSRESRFREDLYYRLKVVELRVPPLRERGADIHILAQHFLQLSCNRLERPLLEFSAETLQAMSHYHWPGNVRELENAIERAVILADNHLITPALLDIEHHQSEAYQPVRTAPPQVSMEEYFQRFVLEHQDQMTETELAQKLGISRKCLWERRQRLGIPKKRILQPTP